MTQTIDNSKKNLEPLALEKLVSGLLDEQITSEELNELLNEEGVNETFYRYNMVSKILHDEVTGSVSLDFVNLVSQKLDNETLISTPFNNVIPLFSKIKKITGGMAIAASVATFVSVQTVQVAQDDDLFGSGVVVQSSQAQTLPADAIVSKNTIDPANYWLETAEQKELELFNDKFMSKARQSEQESIAPFARTVRGQRIGTIRFSKEQWQYILRRSTRLKEAKKENDKANK